MFPGSVPAPTPALVNAPGTDVESAPQSATHGVILDATLNPALDSTTASSSTTAHTTCANTSGGDHNAPTLAAVTSTVNKETSLTMLNHEPNDVGLQAKASDESSCATAEVATHGTSMVPTAVVCSMCCLVLVVGSEVSGKLVR